MFQHIVGCSTALEVKQRGQISFYRLHLGFMVTASSLHTYSLNPQIPQPGQSFLPHLTALCLAIDKKMTALKCLVSLHSCPELPGMHTAYNPKHKVKYFENRFFSFSYHNSRKVFAVV